MYSAGPSGRNEPKKTEGDTADFINHIHLIYLTGLHSCVICYPAGPISTQSDGHPHGVVQST